MPVSLGDLATRFGCELLGDPDVVVEGLASLGSADEHSLSFLASAAFRPQLANTRAAAVILKAGDAADCPVAALIAEDPYACYARMAAVVCPAPRHEPGRHATAAVAGDAEIAGSAHLAAHAVVGERTVIGEDVYLGPGCVVGPDCVLGSGTRLVANVTLARNVRIGARCTIHPGAVIGADGFGNAMTPEGWVKVPQFGGVRIGDDVEIGANSTVDCGALDDTVIEDGVRIDNLCMIAHNVVVGAHTAMASMAGISGSTTIGKRCIFAGQSGTVGHISICDDVIVSARAAVTKNVTEPGVYASVLPAEPAKIWNKRLALLRRLGKLQKRVARLEQGDD